MAEYTQELQQIWAGALRAAIEGNVATKNTAEEGGVAKYSIREIDGRVMPVIDTKNDTRKQNEAQSYIKTLVNEENPFATILGKSYLYDMLDLAEKKKVISSVSSTAKKRSEIFEPKPSNQTVPQTAPGVKGKKSARDEQPHCDIRLAEDNGWTTSAGSYGSAPNRKRVCAGRHAKSKQCLCKEKPGGVYSTE